MNRATMGALAVCIALFACGRGDRDSGNTGDGTAAESAEVRPTVVSETGCLTARGDQFVLTDLESAQGEATTETYQLIGSEEQLRPHVGQQVQVTGEAEAPNVAMVQESTPPPADGKPQGTTGSDNRDAAPKVSTQAQTRMEVRKLTVTSVQATGASCAAEAETGGAPATRPPQ